MYALKEVITQVIRCIYILHAYIYKKDNYCNKVIDPPK